MNNFQRVLIPEMNTGQFVNLIRSQYLIDARSLTKVSGQPFKIREIMHAIETELEDLEERK